jgi:hypothetical protein
VQADRKMSITTQAIDQLQMRILREKEGDRERERMVEVKVGCYEYQVKSKNTKTNRDSFIRINNIIYQKIHSMKVPKILDFTM